MPKDTFVTNEPSSFLWCGKHEECSQAPDLILGLSSHGSAKAGTTLLWSEYIVKASQRCFYWVMKMLVESGREDYGVQHSTVHTGRASHE